MLPKAGKKGPHVRAPERWPTLGDDVDLYRLRAFLTLLNLVLNFLISFKVRNPAALIPL